MGEVIWKFVEEMSAITGVVCFGLGSTYDMSFGKLGYGGPLVYLFVCSFMWRLRIWGKRIQVSEKFMIWDKRIHVSGEFMIWDKRIEVSEKFMIWGKRIQVSEKFKGVVGAILFVVICSISVVYKKYVPGKSDAYTITSYGSFALMSVSLSRKLELGFETGLSAFFLKLFASQLLKIKWFLLPIALVFCSLVIILRHYPESRSQYSQQEATNNQKNNETESTQAASQDSGEKGEVSGEGPLSTNNEQNSQEESSQAEDQVSSETKVCSSAEPEFISAATTGIRRRPANIQNKQEEDSTSSSLGLRPRMFAVLKLHVKGEGATQSAMAIVAEIPGIDSISMDMNQKKLTVMGTFDAGVVARTLRKLCRTHIVSKGRVKEPEKKEEPKEDTAGKTGRARRVSYG